MTVMPYLVSGALVMGYSIAAMFFFRYWSQTRDRLFVFFGAAFICLAVQRLILSLLADPDAAIAVYGIRLAAFLLILIAIVDKNRR